MHVGSRDNDRVNQFVAAVGTDMSFHAEIPLSSDEKMVELWKASAKRHAEMARAAQRACARSGRARDYVAAYLMSWKSALDYYGNRSWQTDMNLANQLMQKCVVAFYGTKRGAECETDLELNIRRKMRWGRSEP